VANLGASLWGHSQGGQTASIRAARIQYTVRCHSKGGCRRAAVIQIECRDGIGHPFWNRDFRESHAKPIFEKAERLKIPCPGRSKESYERFKLAAAEPAAMASPDGSPLCLERLAEVISTSDPPFRTLS